MKKKKTLIILFLLLLAVLFFGFVQFHNISLSKRLAGMYTSTSFIHKTILDEMTKEQIEKYYLVYKNPYVIYLRKRLNTLAQASKHTDSQTVTDDSGSIEGLSLFRNDVGYYKSKFIVLTINNNLVGGSTIRILFQDKPDRIFSAWVYKLAGGEYELRGFSTSEKDKTTKKLVDYLKPALLDSVHAL